MSNSDKSTLLQLNYKLLNNFFYSYVLIFWVFKWIKNLQLHQLDQPVLAYVGMDPLYWFLVAIGFPQAIVNSTLLSASIDITILLAALGSLFFHNKKLFNWVFTSCYFIYFLVFNTYLAHHFHSVGILFVSLIFLNKGESRSSWNTFLFVRYYFFFMLFSAFLWKLLRGNFLDVNYFSSLLRQQNIYFLQANAGSWKSDLLFYLIENPMVSHVLWVGLMLLQASFCVGFFTRRFDLYGIFLFLAFIVGSWLLMNIENFDNLIWLLVLMPFGTLLNKKELKNIPNRFI